jgi:cation:H+ antiporter
VSLHPALQAVVFVVSALLSLRASGTLVARIERVAERVGATEALLGLVAALCADAPEVASSVTALARGQRDVGAGVVLGSNVFNLAALLGLGAVVAGRIALHRRVVGLDGTVASWMAAVTLVMLLGGVAPVVGLALVLVVFVPYVAISAAGPRRAARVSMLPRSWRNFLARAVRDEEAELSTAVRPAAGGVRDAWIAAAALVVVVGASVVMEATGASLGARWGVPDIVTGGIVLAAVTSMPNAVAAIHLARRGRGAATLATALNSNTLNVVVGLFVPAAVVGYGAGSAGAVSAAWWVAGLTALTLLMAWLGRGLRRAEGAAIIAGYAAFVVVLVLR